jgi:hypothetical protein
MRVSLTEEMIELRKIFIPYSENGVRLVKDAPSEAVEAFKKYEKLYDEAYKRNKRIDLL